MNFLDCTLRDGGYYNNWEFSNSELNQYLNFIKNNPIDIIEIGFRFIKNKIFYGPYAFSSEDFLNSIKFPKNKKVSVMINAKDFYTDQKLIEKNFVNKKSSPIDIVRVAVNYDEFDKCKAILIKLKSLGYKIGLNLMKANYIDESFAIKAFKKIDSWKVVDVLYFADSLGCMEAQDIVKISNFFKKYWVKDFGIHAHNNKGLAISNTLIAISEGATWVDSTILGMGRGAGNVPTESLLIELNDKENLENNFSNINLFYNLKKKYEWGYNPYYHYSAVHKIHPSYVQVLIEDKRYENEKIFNFLEKLSKIKTSNFNPSLLDEDYDKFYNNNYDVNKFPIKLLNHEEVIIFGSGPSIFKFKDFIYNFIKKKKLLKFALNYSSIIDLKSIDYFIISHISRVNIEIKDLIKTNKKIIAPQAIIDKFKIPKKKSLSYGLKIGKKFSANRRYCEAISPLAIVYALLLLSQTDVKRIYLAGIDGYDDEILNQEINNFFQFFKTKYKKVEILNITPTKFKFLDNYIIY